MDTMMVPVAFPRAAHERARKEGDAWVRATVDVDEAERRQWRLQLGTAAHTEGANLLGPLRSRATLAEGRFAMACADLLDPALAAAVYGQFRGRIEDERMFARMLGRDMAPRRMEVGA